MKIGKRLKESYDIPIKSTFLGAHALPKKYKNNKDSKPLILMGYYQMIFNYGEKKFIKECKRAGVNGIIVVDLSYPDNKKFSQLCKKNSKEYRCGIIATEALVKKINKNQVRCIVQDRLDRYKRYIGVCFVEAINLNQWMVRNGHAVAYRR